jgi:hypothetical protein
MPNHVLPSGKKFSLPQFPFASPFHDPGPAETVAVSRPRQRNNREDIVERQPSQDPLGAHPDQIGFRSCAMQRTRNLIRCQFTATDLRLMVLSTVAIVAVGFRLEIQAGLGPKASMVALSQA